MAITKTVANRQLILAVSDAAATFGIRPGMTLAQARALHAAVEHVDHHPHRDAAALQAMARWMLKFSPMVCLAAESEISNLKISSSRSITVRLGKFSEKQELARENSPVAGDWPAIYIDLTGTQRLHGEPECVLELITATLKRWRISASLAIGETVGAAWALTFASPSLYSGRGRNSQFNSLPIVALRLPVDNIAALHHLGVTTVGQLRKLPRDELPSRFGDLILLRIDQALGAADEVVEPIQPLAPIVASRRWEEPVDNLQWIWPIAEKLIEQICGQLLRFGLGAREIQATLRLAMSQPLQRTVRLSRPSRNPRRIFELLRETLDAAAAQRTGYPERTREGSTGLGGKFRRQSGIATARLTSDLSDIDCEGFVAIRLEVTRYESICAEQITLLGAEEFAGRLELDDLVERLRVRMDLPSVSQVRLIESYLPERAFVLEEEATEEKQKETTRPGDQATECANVGSPTLSLNLSGDSFLASTSSLRRFGAPPLPLRLFQPEELRVIVTPSHDRDGRPVQITTGSGDVLPIIHSIGPRRVSGEWWTGHDKSRDYFDAELNNGRRWLIFRVNETGRWFWQGEF